MKSTVQQVQSDFEISEKHNVDYSKIILNAAQHDFYIN